MSFDGIPVGSEREREQHAAHWVYRTSHALARGVFTPANDNKIILFVTESQQEVLSQYADKLTGQVLHWEGETGHANDQRIANAATNEEELHRLYRGRYHMPSRYLGRSRSKSKVANRKTQRVYFRAEPECLS